MSVTMSSISLSRSPSPFPPDRHRRGRRGCLEAVERYRAQRVGETPYRRPRGPARRQKKGDDTEKAHIFALTLIPLSPPPRQSHRKRVFAPPRT
jgi:hypothetical protein